MRISDWSSDVCSSDLGRASTVELFDGYRFEIAGSLQFPTASVVSEALGLADLPTVGLEVMSVSMRGTGDNPLIYYTDVMQLMTHLEADHGKIGRAACRERVWQYV